MGIPIGIENAALMNRSEDGAAGRKSQAYPLLIRGLSLPQIRFPLGSDSVLHARACSAQEKQGALGLFLRAKFCAVGVAAGLRTVLWLQFPLLPCLPLFSYEGYFTPRCCGSFGFTPVSLKD